MYFCNKTKHDTYFCTILFLLQYFDFISGLLSWDETSCHVDLAAELDTITNASPPGEESRGGKFLAFSVMNSLKSCTKNITWQNVKGS